MAHSHETFVRFRPRFGGEQKYSSLATHLCLDWRRERGNGKVAESGNPTRFSVLSVFNPLQTEMCLPPPPFLHPSLLRWRVGQREKGPHYRFFEYLLPSSSSSLPPTSFPMIYLSFSPLFQTLRQVGGRENLEGTMMCPQFVRVEKTLLWA